MAESTAPYPAAPGGSPEGEITIPCGICGDIRPKGIYPAREMVHGTREVFRYALCGGCGVLFLVDVPPSMEPYYRNYYSTGAPSLGGLTWKSRLKRHAGSFALKHMGARVSDLVLRFRFPLEFRALAGVGLRPDTRILDVGCGNGTLVELLDWCGFRSVQGCDPFVDEVTFKGGARIVRKDIFGVEGTFDLVMLHHAYEHVPNPGEVARRIAELLAPGGLCLLRFPNVGSVEFQRYGKNWWGIHAPRHFFLYSRRSIEILFSRVGMTIEKSYCDSQMDHYLYSDEYERDIDDASPLSFRRNGRGTWTVEQLRERAQKARVHNAGMTGDWVVYHIRKDTAG